MSEEMSEQNELPACPFCGRIGEPAIAESIIDSRNVGCYYCEIFLRPEDWKSRPLEDALLARSKNAEAIINGMFPMWIAAMSYCEHGRAADMDRMRNYYNGRDNPLTSEQLHMLFEIQEREVKG